MLDLCDQRGATVLGWIRGGEWVKYSVDVKQSGTYNVSARISSPYDPPGTITTEWDCEASGSFSLANTTSHNAFERQNLETRYFEKGTQELTLRMPADEYQNFNINYVQLDLLKVTLSSGFLGSFLKAAVQMAVCIFLMAPEISNL